MAIAIGDIHGCRQPLEALVAQLPRDRLLVFLGDYVDRGPESAQVLQYLDRLGHERPCVFLMGNHEAMMAEAIAHTSAISMWLMNGGNATLASYDEDPYHWSHKPPDRRALPGFERFHAALRLYHEDDVAIYVHAGLDVREPRLAAQSPEVLLWIRERFFRSAAEWHGKPIVFGHTPTQTMGVPRGQVFRAHRIVGIDTGCVYGGALTALDMETGTLWQQPAGHVRQTDWR